jgi:Ca2+-binding EF-hand superfamily protein
MITLANQFTVYDDAHTGAIRNASLRTAPNDAERPSSARHLAEVRMLVKIQNRFSRAYHAVLTLWDEVRHDR